MRKVRGRVGPQESIVIVDGAYALHARLWSLLDIRVAVVGGVHFSLLSKVQYDIGESCPLDSLIDSIFPCSGSISNQTFIMLRLELTTVLCHRLESQSTSSNAKVSFIEMYLRPPSVSEEARINDWIKVGRMTLGYNVVVSYKRASTSVIEGNFSLSLETIDTLGETYMMVGAEASRMGVNGPWNTKSYLEMILERKGRLLDAVLLLFWVPRLYTPPLSNAPNAVLASNQERLITAPKPLRVSSNLVNRLEDLSQPWTRSPREVQNGTCVSNMAFCFTRMTRSSTCSWLCYWYFCLTGSKQ
ncbi:hypothetical protein RND71_024024 [Anisodus tanguticus]|uniref:Phosphoribulokinase/uridine kinase domain-containing protein n=1 Tax=Anisodus tanguticus TaxID=243964 RepID=A0AAE1RW92_9SOLA|nr:hypothetical protein RND71_024024 [Anisodus tanguticus]